MGEPPKPRNVRAAAEALHQAAREAGRAPSILNTQPWRWRLRYGLIELYADRDRQVTSIDPQGRLLLISCGAALHHARVALAFAGLEPAVTLGPDPRQPDLLAMITVTGPHPPSRRDLNLHRAMWNRRTERRPFTTVAVPPDALSALYDAAAAEQAWLYRIASDQMSFLTTAVKLAQEAETGDISYGEDLHDWTRRRRTSGQGVPPETVVAPVHRPVPLRDLTSGGETMLHPGFGDDESALYLVLATENDEPLDWVRAGEATSALWLTATARGLAASVISDVVEVSDARAMLHRLLPRPGHPQLLVRVGMDLQPTRPPATPRRPAEEFIDIDKSG